MIKVFVILFSISSQIFFVNCNPSLSEDIFIRTNQVGFLPEDLKTAIILSEKDLSDRPFLIVDAKSDEIVYKNKVKDTAFVYEEFNYCYEIDFSSVQSKGVYRIKISETESYPFQINSLVFNSVRDSLSLFFKVQRCGPTNPLLHQPCHLSDAAKVLGYKDSTSRDLTGGWHDAGDYVKFLKTTAYTTYLLLFSYEFDPGKFGYDLDGNNVPDILEEAKVGIDWLLRCNVDNQTLVSQVQNENDHNIGWRLPENDSLQFGRPAFVSLGKNTIGIYTATLALASKIWKEKFYENEFAENCLSIAEKFYNLRNGVQDIDSTFSNHYPEKDFNGKLALAAIELYNITKEKHYLNEAVNYGKIAGADFWWSVGNINSLAHYKIAQHNSEFSDFISQNLKHSISLMKNSLFEEGLAYSWGTTNTFLGVSFQAILYKELTGSNEFDSLCIYQRDFVLGRNPWGVSFIYNIGTKFPKNLHSQIAFFNKGYLPGALTAGPAPSELLSNYEIKRSNFEYNRFNSKQTKYFDDRFDYITNEPTISGNATALFVYGYFSN